MAGGGTSNFTVLFSSDTPSIQKVKHAVIILIRPSVRKQTIGPDPRERARLTASTMEARTTRPVQR